MTNRSEAPAMRGPPVVVGLVGAAGTPLRKVTRELEKSFGRFGYQTSRIGLSGKLLQFGKNGFKLLNRPIRQDPYDERINDLQTAGNALRERTGRADAMAILACNEFVSAQGGEDGHVYVIRSMKTPSEVETLRSIFGPGFVLVGAYSPTKQRQGHMEHLIADSRGEPVYTEGGHYKEPARKILNRDEAEPGNAFGQNVRETYWLADAFLDVSSTKKMRKNIDRFVDLLFGHPFLTPTPDEQAMYMAYGARLRSSSLHRQVGAALINREGELLAIGCNDVPKFGGGLYWEQDEPDKRDFQLGKDLSWEMKVATFYEVLEKLGEKKRLNPTTKGQLSKRKEKFAEEILPEIKGTRLADLIEFFRTTHAEMDALLSAARNGVLLRNSWLFSTTFPCHECTRHIITAGISRVVYVEPYEKSLGPRLHFDSIAVDEPTASSRLRLDPFVGIGPNLYQRLFRARERREAGTVVKFNRDSAHPLFKVDRDQVLEKIVRAVDKFRNELDDAKLLPGGR